MLGAQTLTLPALVPSFPTRLRPWAGCLTSLCFIFLICKMGLMTVPTSSRIVGRVDEVIIGEGLRAVGLVLINVCC